MLGYRSKGDNFDGFFSFSFSEVTGMHRNLNMLLTACGECTDRADALVFDRQSRSQHPGWWTEH